VVRPEHCPLGHDASIQLNGYLRSRNGTFERPRYRCVPYDGSPAHKFSPRLSIRHAVTLTPDLCVACDRELDRASGARTPHRFEFGVREVANALLRMGEGSHYRKVAAGLRLGLGRPSEQANLVARYVDAFTDVVLDGSQVREWPPIVSVDALFFRTRVLDPIAEKRRRRLPWPRSSKKPRRIPRKRVRLLRKSRSRERGRILVAMGKDSPLSAPYPIRAVFSGGGDETAWRDFFRSLPGKPEWIVADGDAAIANAVASAWDEPPIFYRSHPHMIKNCFEAAKRAGLPEDDPLWARLEEVLVNPEERYADLEIAAARLDDPTLATWLAEKREVIREMARIRARLPDHPRSTGAIEQLLGGAKRILGSRSHLFNNAARFDRLLALMIAHTTGYATEARYTSVLRRWFGDHRLDGGYAWADAWDEKGTSSIETLIADAQARADARRVTKQAASKAKRHREKRAAYDQARAEAGLPPPPKGRPRNAVAKGSVAGKTVAEIGWLAATWHPTKNGGLRPEDVGAGAGQEIWWQCDRGPDHDWPAQVRSRSIGGSGCPYCAHRKVAPSDSLAATHPEVAAQWHATKNGDLKPTEVTYGSQRKVWWQCPKAKSHTWLAKVQSRTSMLSGCPKCARLAGKGGRPPRTKPDFSAIA
jgi:hypothetical protein